MNGNAAPSSTTRPVPLNSCAKKMPPQITNLIRQQSWQDELAESDINIPGSPRTPRTSTTPGEFNPNLSFTLVGDGLL